MALNASSLESDLRDMFEATTDTPSEAAQKLADIYEAYAVAGEFGVGNTWTVLPPNKAGLLAALLSGIAPAPTGAVFASSWSTGLLAFWAANPVAGVQTGTTVPPTGAAAMIPILTLAFAAPQEAAQAAAALAGALDTCTKTVTAAITLPAPAVLPIT